MKPLDTRRACNLDAQPEQSRWLIDGLWADQGVGIVGGEPKCCKSFLALDMAVAVASGTPCLRQYEVNSPGRVLLFAAEDALHVVRTRLQGIAKVAGIDFESLDVHVITAVTVRLDLAEDRQRLHDTVASLAPRLLILDPFVRLHRIDENTASEVAPLLAYLRELQRRFDVSVVLVHHSRKGGHARAGQALRGSSELHAWGDSNLYLRRKADQLLLSIEHRAAPSSKEMLIELRGVEEEQVALQLIEHVDAPAKPKSPSQRVVAVLTAAEQPMTRREIRNQCRMNAAAVGDVLAELMGDGKIVENFDGYRLC